MAAALPIRTTNCRSSLSPRDELEAHDFPPFVAHEGRIDGNDLPRRLHRHRSRQSGDDLAQGDRRASSAVISAFKGLLLSDDTSMNALAGTIGERAANIIAGGCDIVLHCNGIMDEMQQVVRERAGIGRCGAGAGEGGGGRLRRKADARRRGGDPRRIRRHVCDRVGANCRDWACEQR